MSEIIKLKNGSYEFKIPSPPSREEDILFITEKKKDQFWRTPQPHDFRRMNVREKVKAIDTDRERWENGCFFMNNGELTYINGLHYDHLVNMTFANKKAFYLDNQRLDFYFRQLTWEHPKCKGRVIAKGRRVGASMEEITEATYRGMQNFNQNIALISIEERKTKKTLFNPLVNSFVKRPKHMRPLFYKPNGKKPKQELLLATDDLDVDSEFEQELDRLEMNSVYIPFPTSVSALDGYIIGYCSADEVWKWTAANPKEFLETSLPCFDDGGEKAGIISMLSTLGDTDDVKEAVEAGIYIYQNSDVKNLTEDGYTQTGLWNWFISAIYAERAMRDIYGKINEDKATAKILKERGLNEEGSQAWINSVRRKPLTEEEAMATALGSTTFDNIRLQEKITIINKLPTNEKPYVLGELHEDSSNKNKVHFEPTNNGNWQIAWHPKKSRLDGKDFSNRWYEDLNGILHMNKSPEGILGYDPVQFGDKQARSKNVSKSAIIGRYKFDYFDNKDKYGRSCAGQYSCLYHFRDEDPEISHYEYLKALKYYGFMGTHEAQVNSVYTVFKDAHALSFLQKYGNPPKYGLWTDGQKRVIKKGINKFQALIKRPKIGDHDFLKDIPFEQLLQQAKELDPNDTRKSDIFMANTMMEHGLEKIFFADVIDEMLEEYGMNDTTLATMFGK